MLPLEMNLFLFYINTNVYFFSYGLIGSVSAILKAEMEPFMDTAIDHMIDAVASCEGLTVRKPPKNPQIFITM